MKGQTTPSCNLEYMSGRIRVLNALILDISKQMSLAILKMMFVSVVCARSDP